MTKLTNRRFSHLAIVLLVLMLLTSCDIFPAARNQPADQTSTGTPASPTPGIKLETEQKETQRPTESPFLPTPAPTEAPSLPPQPTSPILERALDEKPISLIDGRLFVQMPVGAQDVARQQSVMSAGQTNRGETRLVLEGNGQQLAVYAQETFYYTDNVEDDLDKILKLRYGDAFTYTKEAVKQSGDGFKVICFSPGKIDTSANSVLIRGAVAVFADGTFVTIGVYVSPETAADQALCRKQAGNILETIRTGTRKIDVSAHEDRLGENSLTIKLDDGYEIVQNEGVDFSVFYLMKFVKLGEPAPSIGIYIGFYPTMQYSMRGIDESQLTSSKDMILNKSVEWKCYKPSPGKEDYSAETAFYLNKTLIMHIFVDAANEAEFMEIKKMIDTMRIK